MPSPDITRSPSSSNKPRDKNGLQVAIIGGGPSGLMAAEVLSGAGLNVDLYDAMPSLGRKFLRAGLGGLNITHSEPFPAFCARYGDRQSDMQALLESFPPQALREWVHGLGIETFVGSSGRVFPSQMKAAPLLRAWLHRLRKNGVRFHIKSKWLGFESDGSLRLAGPTGQFSIKPDATILALGGASWPQLGSTGVWVPWLKEQGVEVAPFESANCGFDVDWSAHLREKFAHQPLKSVALTFTDLKGVTETRQGELLVSDYGVEGSLIYTFSQRLRGCLKARGKATFTLDLQPERSAKQVLAALSRPRGSKSISHHLKSCLGITGLKTALLYEVLSREQIADPAVLAKTIKLLPISVRSTRPIEEAISTAGGVCFDSLDDNLMLKEIPGVFVAGEMLDWEAPTGGYLLSACLATGLRAGLGVKNWLNVK